MTKEALESIKSNREHIEKVRNLLNFVVTELLRRGETHDQSKLVEPELSTFAKYTPRLSEMTYGDDEYKQCLKEMGPALEHHYTHNRHHPEFHSHGINGMNLVDILEMFVDWYASSQRHSDGDIYDSIEKNRKRFGLSDQLCDIFRNTGDLLRIISWRDDLVEAAVDHSLDVKINGEADPSKLVEVALEVVPRVIRPAGVEEP